ncbi:MAG: TIGR01777 family oxidoreductase [Candidatus Poseidoniaceae archaeon]|nr:TIGR01777 family oxidoreductase [Candidatus Poseidoniaceae archaeon]
MPIYEHTATFPYPRDVVWNWHARPGAVRRIMPDWEGIRPVEVGGIKDGAVTSFRMSIGILPQRWVAKHHSYIEGEQFCDDMIKGPFGRWNHVHKFIETGQTEMQIQDRIDWKLPFHFFTRIGSPIMVMPRVRQMFKHRTRRILADLKRQQMFKDAPRKRILISGSTGLIGTQLGAFLETDGHDVHRLIRPSTRLHADQDSTKVVKWDDKSGKLIEGSLENFDVIIHLAGAGIGDKRWSKKRKKLIAESREIPTKNLANALANLASPPSLFMCASAVGYYDNRGDEELDEKSSTGNGFLAEICRKWEDAAQPAINAGIRTIHMRTGIVTTAAGGMLQQILLPAKLGAMGPIGGGRQWQSWISLDDQIYAMHYLMNHETASGVFNLTAPNPVTQKQFAKVLGKVLRRPAFAPAPGFVMKILFGEMGKSLILDGQKVRPKRLQDLGYTFEHETLEPALRDALGRFA